MADDFQLNQLELYQPNYGFTKVSLILIQSVSIIKTKTAN